MKKSKRPRIQSVCAFSSSRVAKTAMVLEKTNPALAKLQQLFAE